MFTMAFGQAPSSICFPLANLDEDDLVLLFDDAEACFGRAIVNPAAEVPPRLTDAAGGLPPFFFATLLLEE
jgi:hypothetical protein